MTRQHVLRRGQGFSSMKVSYHRCCCWSGIWGEVPENEAFLDLFARALLWLPGTWL